MFVVLLCMIFAGRVIFAARASTRASMGVILLPICVPVLAASFMVQMMLSFVKIEGSNGRLSLLVLLARGLLVTPRK